MAALGFSEIQAQAILDLQLRRLSALERQKILDEYEAIIKHIAELENILQNESVLRQVIVDELEEVKKDFGDARRTEIVDAGVELQIEDLIADEDVAITVTKAGYIKRTPVSTYSATGTRRQGPAWGDGEERRFCRTSLHRLDPRVPDDLHGRRAGVQDEGARDSRGRRGRARQGGGQSWSSFRRSENWSRVMPVRDFAEETLSDDGHASTGVIKKTSLADFQNIRANGINAINIDEGDELLDVIRTDGKQQIFIATHDGMAVRFNETDVRPMGRAARGVRGVNLRKGDYVVSVCAVSPEGNEKILSVSEKGFGKQTHGQQLSPDQARRQRRDQYENDRQDRQGRCGVPGRRGQRDHDHHAAGETDPARMSTRSAKRAAAPRA